MFFHKPTGDKVLHHQVKPKYGAWPPEVRQRALAKFGEGSSAAEVSRALNVPDETVRVWAREAGVSPHSRAERRRQYVREHAATKTDKEISIELKISQRTVNSIRNQLRLPPSSRPRAILTPEDKDLVQALAARGFRQEQVAALYGVTQAAISRYQCLHKIRPCNRDLSPYRSWATDQPGA